MEAFMKKKLRTLHNKPDKCFIGTDNPKNARNGRIRIIEDRLLNTKSHILVQLVNDEGDLKKNIPCEIHYEYRHVTKEYIKFINHCRKYKLKLLGETVYVPLDCWALGLVDTTKNKRIDTYDKDFKYIACAFVRKKEGEKYIIDYNALKECLSDILNKAKYVNTDVAIVYSDIVESAVNELLDKKSNVNVFLVKENSST